MTVVIDCNIWVICLTSRSRYHHIFKSLVDNKFQLTVSADIMLEYEEVLQQKYNSTVASSFTTLLGELPNVDYQRINFNWQLISKDPDDNKYCDCAIAGQADYIVTEDRHFEALKNIPFPSISVLGIDDFIEMLK